MKEIRNVIPLLPFATQLISDDKELTITFKYFYRDQSLTFFEENAYFEWKNILKDFPFRQIRPRAPFRHAGLERLSRKRRRGAGPGERLGYHGQMRRRRILLRRYTEPLRFREQRRAIPQERFPR